MSASEVEKSSESAAPPSSSKVPLLAAVLTLVNLGGTGFVATKVMTPPVVTCAEAAPAADDATDRGAVHGPTAPLDAFVVNLNEPGSARYLKTAVEIEVDDQKTVDALVRAKPAVRDEALRYLSNLSVADTQGEAAKAKIQGELITRMDKVLGGGGRVRNLYFTEFVVQ
jgi:flagellar basal body-associated protein FliL